MINATKLLTCRGQPSIVNAAEKKNRKNFTVYSCTFSWILFQNGSMSCPSSFFVAVLFVFEVHSEDNVVKNPDDTIGSSVYVDAVQKTPVVRIGISFRMGRIGSESSDWREGFFSDYWSLFNRPTALCRSGLAPRCNTEESRGFLHLKKTNKQKKPHQFTV